MGVFVFSVLLDLDGTIVDSAPGIIGSYQHALRCMGLECPPASELTWVVGPPSRRSFTKFIGPDHDLEEAVQLYRSHYEANGLFDCAVYPGMREAIAALAAMPVRLFVCTSKPLGFAERIIEHVGLTHPFERIYGADLEGRFDDKGILIDHIIGVEQIDPQRTVMIGDRASDMLAATHHEIAAVGALWGYGDADELTQAGATSVCPSPDDLLAHVGDVLRASVDARR
jgi:phosphoglycolate phosphatase